MKAKHIIIATLPGLCLTSCGNDDSTRTLSAELASARDSISALRNENDNLKTSVARLSDENRRLAYPSADRLNNILKLVDEQNYIKARLEIDDLIKTFPKSAEASRCPSVIETIQKAEDKKRAEEERIKALGFKALKSSLTFTIDYNKIVISNISTGSQFVFDAYDNSWHYREADRDNKYITAAMSVTSSSKNPQLPQFAVYTVKGDKMNFAGTFKTEYARWRDYGAYLGNYSDSQNDFSKVSTVRFKLGCELPAQTFSEPYAIVVRKENVLTEGYERFNNPPKYWTGTAAYPTVLTLTDFTSGNYLLVKLTNI